MHCLPRKQPRTRSNQAVRHVVSSLILIAATSGCGSKSDGPAIAAPDQPPSANMSVKGSDAKSILAKMVDAYANATTYSDQARICLRYRQHGRSFQDEAPLSVKRNGDQFDIRAYLATVVCDGESMMATIQDEASGNIDGQVLVRSIQNPFTIQQLYHDPILRDALTSGLGRQPAFLTGFVTRAASALVGEKRGPRS